MKQDLKDNYIFGIYTHYTLNFSIKIISKINRENQRTIWNYNLIGFIGEYYYK